ncbi:hypothetical protein KHC33_00260 [Methanospirillum sp. J.3.6.1-F.2.7.3]|uniref:Uncharacterized protein n=1 Tax=Methanospirillum purgamenti TaxID=2834276 RepID=A0A8E7EK09_9EURY|nr:MULTISPECIES: hypothetical protein [Methanospirillum]MDX8549628.1 hypothetical protein [Methanospirillum hungatei]QVV89010.1 hypothetical protein KHC33_00260 [Methanospirillum sp. J.3.6.1-F.2.7.3]
MLPHLAPYATVAPVLTWPVVVIDPFDAGCLVQISLQALVKEICVGHVIVCTRL